MPELRLNLITREWVIIATERALRPEEFYRQNGEAATPADQCVPAPAYVDGCPFCPGNEDNTPDEIMRLPQSGEWQVRVTPNKFPALSEHSDKTRLNNGVCHSMGGYGRHEVVIETPSHHGYIANMSLAEIEVLLQTYQIRFHTLYQDPDIEHIIIFKNHGEAAGTSLIHPHSQIIAMPLAPMQVRDRVESCRRYFDDTGECLMCASIMDEISDGSRMLLDTEHFVSFIPYAALSPFHIWIFPKRHEACFGNISEHERADIARHLKHVLERLFVGLNNPGFNYVIRSAAPNANVDDFHWYISLVPRVNQPAGFELGSGMYINSAIPEESAEFLRNITL